MEKKLNSTNVNFAYYAVALIDILNQKEILKKIKKLPENEEEQKEFNQNWKDSAGVVKGLRKTFDSFLDRYTHHDLTKYNNLSEDQKRSISRMLNYEIKKQQFSDTIILYTSLEDNRNHFSINNIQALFIALSGTLIMALSIGKVFRGGIEVHIASDNYFEGEELYGPALCYAYDLENKIAQYPRIVIGDELYNYLQNESFVKENDIESKYRREMSENLKKMVCVDIDGVPILDYLGGVIKKQFGEDGD